MHTAGRSDKYGQVYVEQLGSTGFDDPHEPVALLRAQDKHAVRAMTFYYGLMFADPDVSDEQRRSVGRQVYAFQAWAAAFPDKVRTPGAPAACTNCADGLVPRGDEKPPGTKCTTCHGTGRVCPCGAYCWRLGGEAACTHFEPVGTTPEYNMQRAAGITGPLCDCKEGEPCPHEG